MEIEQFSLLAASSFPGASPPAFPALEGVGVLVGVVLLGDLTPVVPLAFGDLLFLVGVSGALPGDFLAAEVDFDEDLLASSEAFALDPFSSVGSFALGVSVFFGVVGFSFDTSSGLDDFLLSSCFRLFGDSFTSDLGLFSDSLL